MDIHDIEHALMMAHRTGAELRKEQVELEERIRQATAVINALSSYLVSERKAQVG